METKSLDKLKNILEETKELQRLAEDYFKNKLGD